MASPTSCRNCGGAVTPGTSVCPACGNALGGVGKPQPAKVSRSYRSDPPGRPSSDPAPHPSPTPKPPPTLAPLPPQPAGRSRSYRAGPTPVIMTPVPGAGGARLNTSPERAAAVTVGVALLVIIAGILLWLQLTTPNLAADRLLSSFVYGSHGLSPLPGDAFSSLGYTAFMFALIVQAPVLAASGYWLGLRRLFRDAPAVAWWRIVGLNAGLALAALTTLGIVMYPRLSTGALNGFTPTSALWPLAALLYFPALLLVLAVVIAVASGAGYGFARFFARWPLERMRSLRSVAWQDGLVVGALALAMLLGQSLLATAAEASGQPFTTGWWFVPLAALATAGFAGWAALRPLPPP